VRSYRTRFTLAQTNLVHIGGFVSVALSLRSPAVAVSNRPALCCPDFPHDLSIAQPLLDLTISIMTEEERYFNLAREHFSNYLTLYTERAIDCEINLSISQLVLLPINMLELNVIVTSQRLHFVEQRH
jgi:hypothetical protein